MSNWLVDKLIPSIMRSESQKSSVPEGLWHKCPSCEAVLYRPELEKTWMSARSATTTCASTRVPAWTSSSMRTVASWVLTSSRWTA